jgi:hypothetical protein
VHFENQYDLRRSSEQGQSVDALGQRADEGRGARRYASGSREQAVIRGFPNGATPPPSWVVTRLTTGGNRGN